MRWDWAQRQADVCRKYGAEFVPSTNSDKVGIALNVKTGLKPIHGVRMLPENGTSGWYIWAGPEMSTSPEFFKPVHVEHLEEWCEPALPFLGLPPGWRFLVAGDHVDVWFDPEVDLSPLDRK